MAENLAGRPVLSHAGLWRKLGAARDEDVELVGDGGEGGEGDGGGWIGHCGSLLVSLWVVRVSRMSGKPARGSV